MTTWQASIARNRPNVSHPPLKALEVKPLLSHEIAKSFVDVYQLDPETCLPASYSKGEVAQALDSLLMGAVKRSDVCTSCGGSWYNCQGHSGFMRLNTVAIVPRNAELLREALNSVTVLHGGDRYPPKAAAEDFEIGQPVPREMRDSLSSLWTLKDGRMNPKHKQSGKQSAQAMRKHVSAELMYNIGSALLRDDLSTETYMAFNRSITHVFPILPTCMRPTVEGAKHSSYNEWYKVRQMEAFDRASKAIEKINTTPFLQVPQQRLTMTWDALCGECADHLRAARESSATPRNFHVELSAIVAAMMLIPLSEEPSAVDVVKRFAQLINCISTSLGMNAIDVLHKLGNCSVVGGLMDMQDTLVQFTVSSPKKANGQRDTRRPMVALLTGKEGMIRLDAMSKRVVHFARSVISPGAAMSSSSVNLSVSTLKTLAFKYMVTPDRVEDALEMLRGRRLVLVDRENRLCKVNYESGCSGLQQHMCGLCVCCLETQLKNIEMKGGIMHFRRLVQTGDVVVINRQPTLSSASMQGVTVALDACPNKRESIRVPVPITGAFNADFDGDEMNVLLPETSLAQMEMRLLMHNRLSPMQTTMPVQDMLHGAGVLATDCCVLSPRVASRAIALVASFAPATQEGTVNINPTRAGEGSMRGFDVLHMLFRTVSGGDVEAQTLFPDMPPEGRLRVVEPLHVCVLSSARQEGELFGRNSLEARSGANLSWTLGRNGVSLCILPSRWWTDYSSMKLQDFDDNVPAMVCASLLEPFYVRGELFVATHGGACVLSDGSTFDLRITGQALDAGHVLANSFYVVSRLTRKPIDRNGIDIVTPVPWHVYDKDASSRLYAGEVYDLDGDLQARFARMDFPVTSKRVKSMVGWLATHRPHETSRIIDAFCAMSILACDARGASVSYSDTRVQEPALRSQVGHLMRAAIREARECAAFKTYGDFAEQLQARVKRHMDEPMESAQHNELRIFTGGVCSKGNLEKFREMVSHAGVRDVGNRFANGDTSASTHHYMPSKAWNEPSGSMSGLPDWNITERGLLSQSYADGIDPETLYFETGASRANLAKSQLEVQSAGYDARKIASSQLDCVVGYDHCVRSGNRIILFASPIMNPTSPVINFDALFVRSSSLCCVEGDDLALFGEGVETVDTALGVVKLRLSQIMHPHAESCWLFMFERFAQAGRVHAQTLCDWHAAFLRLLRVIGARRLYPGTAIGSISASVITQRITQATLDAFHNTSGGEKRAMLADAVIQQPKGARSITADDDIAPVEEDDEGERIAASAILLEDDGGRQKDDGLEESALEEPAQPGTDAEDDDAKRASDADEDEGDRESGGDGEEEEEDASDDKDVSEQKTPAYRYSAPPPKRADRFRNSIPSELTVRIDAESIDAKARFLNGVQPVPLRMAIDSVQMVYAGELFKLRGQQVEKLSTPMGVGLRAYIRATVGSQGTCAGDYVPFWLRIEPHPNVCSGAHSLLQLIGRVRSIIAKRLAASSNIEVRVFPVRSDSGRALIGVVCLATGRKASKGLFARLSKTSLTKALGVMQGFVRGDKLGGDGKSKADHFMKATSTRKRAHKTLDVYSWRGMDPGVCNEGLFRKIRFDDTGGILRAVFPEARLWTVLSQSLPSIDLHTLQALNHDDNVEVLGVEAAARIARQRLSGIWAGMPPFYIILLVEHMAFTGRINAINNRGVINHLDYISRLAFENVRDRLAETRRGSIRDPLQQHVSRVFCGMPVAVGTGYSSIALPKMT